ncbi:MAG: ATP-grasp domain-containing protein [Actinomycetota bacterium]|nr:ATP-grasp domain-containing protein [Actinomycetota bacterium]
MPRLLLLLPTTTYRAPDFVAAAERAGAEVVVGSDRRQALADGMGDRAMVLPFDHPERAVDAIVALNERTPLDAVLAVDDQGVAVAAAASARIGLVASSETAVARTRDKAAQRRRLTRAGLDQPRFRVVPDADEAVRAAVELGFPCVVKPTDRSASQGVLRVDDVASARRGAERVARIAGDGAPLLVEAFVPGSEVAVEGLVVRGRTAVLAVWDKPDPLEGPTFPETIYVTPSRHPAAVLEAVQRETALAVTALGLTEGPVHVELRIGEGGRVTVLEVAARSIGGRCSRALRLEGRASLEDVIVRHALGQPFEGISHEGPASGVMMLPVLEEGVLDHVDGVDEALAVPGVTAVDLTLSPGSPLVPLPEGDRYLGFVFARALTPGEVEARLRQAAAHLRVRRRDGAEPRSAEPSAGGRARRCG